MRVAQRAEEEARRQVELRSQRKKSKPRLERHPDHRLQCLAAPQETLMVAHHELEEAWSKWKIDPTFKAELARLRRDFIGGPTPLYFAKRLTDFCGGAQTLGRGTFGHRGPLRRCEAMMKRCE
eukprot:Skav219768  [mRNA]  locus=scaffold4956:207418:209409:- [translate_table: standard]